jgi:hypothetical protein
MDFDTYWSDLVDRVYNRQETLAGPEELLYRLTCIYGETVVDGLEAYFDRRYAEFDKDMTALCEQGFEEISSDFREARRVMFGSMPLTKASVTPVILELLDEDEAVMPLLAKVNEIYDRLIVSLPRVLDARDCIGIENGYFREDA